jgi:hypothetical protein
MKMLLKSVLVAMSIALAMSIVSCQKDNTDDPAKTPAKYTIMLYGCGGGNVDSQLEDALDGAVEALGVDNNQVNYTVMYSMSAKASKEDFPATYRGEKGKTYRYVLSKDTDLSQAGYRSKYFYKKASEVELYKASTLADFIRWSMENAPAENYILELVNHGGGFDLATEVLTKGIGYDDNQKVDGYAKGVAIATIAEALKETNVHLKAIYWNGCMMGQLEVLTEVAPYCDYQFSSSHVAYARDLHVVALIDALNAQPNDFEAAALAHKKIIEGKGKDDSNSILYNFAHAVNAQTQEPTKVNGDFGCWRSNRVAAINEQVKKLGALLTEVYPTEEGKVSINYATSWVYLYELDYGYSDVLDYAQKVADALEEGEAKTKAQTIAADMKKAIADANVYRINAPFILDAEGRTVATKEGTFSLGISLYAGKDKSDYLYSDPETDYRNRYKASAFDKAVGWSKWLDMNEFRVSSDDEHPNVTNPGNDSTWELFWLDY